ncbi:hypothetical protein L249_3336 [Ophiocordyceps polyrhachis-furcata BCC 54312]|uniref:Uncharacterized protein n=1 Tax=Ophiocordyceps polyrhachis-furcata BCC 54312 TaxID=1330021 RepID=A0A367LQA5_9HYPO|nr:hypothetical protein L249_3336 [Ophiocordyceps polyrhachis-furcata BCC 54312]
MDLHPGSAREIRIQGPRRDLHPAIAQFQYLAKGVNTVKATWPHSQANSPCQNPAASRRDDECRCMTYILQGSSFISEVSWLRSRHRLVLTSCIVSGVSKQSKEFVAAGVQLMLLNRAYDRKGGGVVQLTSCRMDIQHPRSALQLLATQFKGLASLAGDPRGLLLSVEFTVQLLHPKILFPGEFSMLPSAVYH